MPPLAGIIHAAGILDDGIIPQQSRARFEAVLRPKVDGGWNLHRLTAERPLDFFILVSSVAGLWGNPGQAPYAAANAFLDQLAHFRRQRGLPATSIDFGAWSGGGMATNLSESVRQERAGRGVAELDPEIAVRSLDRAVARDRVQLAVFAGRSPMLADKSPKFAPADPVTGSRPSSLEETIERTSRNVMELCGGSRIDASATLPELGLDSLSILLLRGRLVTEFGAGASLPVVRFLEGHSVRQLSEMIFEKFAPAPSPVRLQSLIAVRRGGDGVPIILIPPAVSTPSIFGSLGQAFDARHPIYSVNPLGLDGTSEPHDSVEAMASHYLEEVRSAIPSGPYILGGACFGGFVAWEMARQLSLEGENVPLLILLDTAAPELASFSKVKSSMRLLGRMSRRVFHHIRYLTVGQALARRIAPDQAQTARDLRRAMLAHKNARNRYRAVPLDRPVLLLQSEEYEYHTRTWKRLISGPLELVRFPRTRHVQIFDESHTGEVAAVLNRCLAAMTR
jgi:thioesterase domain-containing protein